MRHVFFFSILLIVIGSSCKKTITNPTTIINHDTTIIIRNDTTIIINNDTTVVKGDHQIRFSLPGNIVYNTEYSLTGDENNIHKFNIDYYPDVDSVFFSFISFVQNGNSGTVELYNVTDGMPVEGGSLKVVSNEAGAYYQSPNIVASFPHKEITLGIRLKGSKQGSYLNAVGGYLYLYRK